MTREERYVNYMFQKRISSEIVAQDIRDDLKLNEEKEIGVVGRKNTNLQNKAKGRIK